MRELPSYSDALETSNMMIESGAFCYASGSLVFEGRRLNFDKRPKYSVNVGDAHGNKIGYFSFYVISDQRRLQMAGLFIEPSFRKQGMSYTLLQEIHKLAEANCLQFVDTTHQRKPLTCAVLRKAGFEPLGGLREFDKIHVGRIIDDTKKRVGIHFGNSRQAEHFEQSNIADSQGCKVVKSFEELTSPTEIVLGARYKLNSLIQD